MDAGNIEDTRPASRIGWAPIILGLFICLFAQNALRADEKAHGIAQTKLRDFDAVTLQLPYMHQFQFAGYYAAVEKNFYAQEGLTVTIREGTVNETAVDVVLSGRAQYGVTGSELVVDRLNGKPVVAVAAIFQHSPSALISDSRKGIYTPKDLVGKRVMMELNQRDVETLAMLKKTGVDVSRIRIRRNTWKVDELASGQVDVLWAYVTNEPFQLRQLGIPCSIIQPIHYGIDFYGDCLFTSENEARMNHDRVAAFRRASLRGWDWAMKNPNEMTAIILNKYMPRQRTLTMEGLLFEAAEMRKLILPELIPVGEMHPERWEQIAQIYADLGFVSKPYSLDGFLFEKNDAKSPVDYPWLKWLMGAFYTLVLVALVVILWNVQLRRQVEKRTRQLSRQNKEIQREAEALRRAEENLKASEAKFRRIYDANIMGMFYASAQGDILEANDAFLIMLGFTREDLDTGLVQSMVFADPRTRPLELEALREIAERGVCTSYEKELLRRDGGRVPTLITAASVSSVDNSVIAIVQDISEKRRLVEEQIKTSKLEAIGVLAGGIAHDFNNLLTPILGNLSLARNTSENTPGIDGFLQLAEKACWRARDLTQQLLTFARGGAPVKKEAVLSDLIRDSTLFALHGSNVRGEFNIVENLWTVEADQGQLSQVLQNLVINAVHAMPHGGVIRISARNVDKVEHPNLPVHPGRHVCIEVKDEGVGISPENLQRIFDPYFTTKPHGHGLGLATSFSIVRRHEGYLAVTSELGSGSTFSVFLPASEHKSKSAAAKPSPIKAQSAGGRILVMDDEPEIQQLVCDMLGHLGYKVEVVGSGEEAVNVYRENAQQGHPFDLVILDLTVPGGMGGAETMKELLKINPAVKSIVCSGYSNDPIVAEYAHYQFKAAVSKPFAFDQLAYTIAAVLSAKG
jgi:two-component system, cell cycle sensor histidine kinase and response regulator CckA